MPTGTDAKVKKPSESDWVSRAEPEPASVSTTLAFGTTAPVGSETTPVRVAKMPWAIKGCPQKTRKETSAAIRENLRTFTDTPLRKHCKIVRWYNACFAPYLLGSAEHMNPPAIALSSKFRKILKRFCGIRFFAGFGVTAYPPQAVASRPPAASARSHKRSNKRFVFSVFV